MANQSEQKQEQSKPTTSDAGNESLAARLKRWGLRAGRIVEYVNGMGVVHAAIIAYVHHETSHAQVFAVNLTVLDLNGATFGIQAVPYSGNVTPGRPASDYWREPMVGA